MSDPVTLTEAHMGALMQERDWQREDSLLVRRALTPSATRLTPAQAHEVARLLVRRAERSGNIEALLVGTALLGKVDELAAAGLGDDVIVEVRASGAVTA